jgi:branched-chain amino acid transport system permease protein
VVRLVIGVNDHQFGDGARFVFTVPQFREWSGLQEGLALRTSQVITLATAIAMVAALFWLLKHTRTGKAMRAFADNEDLALLSGIRPERVVALTWILAGTLAATAGTLYGLDKSFKAFTYFQLLLPIFAAAIVGGLGSPQGAIAGGFLIAFSEIALTYPLRRVLAHLLPDGWEPEGLVQLLPTDYKFAVSFAILVLVLLFRPTGLFRGRSV